MKLQFTLGFHCPLLITSVASHLEKRGGSFPAQTGPRPRNATSCKPRALGGLDGGGGFPATSVLPSANADGS